MTDRDDDATDTDGDVATTTDSPTTWDRRRVLKAGAAGTAIAGAVWAAPSIVSVDAARAATAPPGPQPLLAWVTSGNNLDAIDPSLPAPAVVRSYAGVSLQPKCVAVTLDRATLYVPDSLNAVVRVIDAPTGTELAQIPLTSGAQQMTLDPAGAFAYVSLRSQNAIGVLDLASNTLLASHIAVGPAPNLVGVLPDGSKAYVGCNDGVSVIDTASRSVIGLILVGSGPGNLAVTTDGAYVYIPNLSGNTVSVINTSTDTVVATIPVGATPRFAAAGSNGKAYVSCSDATVWVIDIDTRTVDTSILVGTIPLGMAVTPDDTQLYVSNFGDNTVSVIDTATNTDLVAPIAVSGGATFIAF